ncbi:MAG: DUF2061 domain-containing protein [Alphaproteobacteria bacterium]
MRQLTKTGTYAIMHFIVAVSVSYALTESWTLALGIGIVEPLFQTVAYLVHERIWNRATTAGKTQPASRLVVIQHSHGV